MINVPHVPPHVIVLGKENEKFAPVTPSTTVSEGSKLIRANQIEAKNVINVPRQPVPIALGKENDEYKKFQQWREGNNVVNEGSGKTPRHGPIDIINGSTNHTQERIQVTQMISS